MIFDKMCQAVERTKKDNHKPVLKDLARSGLTAAMKNAAIFSYSPYELEARTTELFEKRINCAKRPHPLLLPFESGVFFHGPLKTNDRGFLIWPAEQMAKTGHGNSIDSPVWSVLSAQESDDKCRMQMSHFFMQMELLENFSMHYSSVWRGSLLWNIKRRVMESYSTHTSDSDAMGKSAESVACKISLILDLINQPKRFIMEESAAAAPKKGNKLNRSVQRPSFTLVSPLAVQKRFLASDPTGRTVCPHARRAYVKTLTHERFVNKRGQQVTVPATWVGDSEFREGNKQYKIRLEL